MKEEMKEKLTTTANKLFKGDLTLKKMDLWLIGAVCLLAGIVYGLMKAPMTHGVMIGSNNGNNNGSNNQDNNNNNRDALCASACDEAQTENE